MNLALTRENSYLAILREGEGCGQQGAAGEDANLQRLPGIDQLKQHAHELQLIRSCSHKTSAH